MTLVLTTVLCCVWQCIPGSSPSLHSVWQLRKNKMASVRFRLKLTVMLLHFFFHFSMLIGFTKHQLFCFSCHTFQLLPECIIIGTFQPPLCLEIENGRRRTTPSWLSSLLQIIIIIPVCNPDMASHNSGTLGMTFYRKFIDLRQNLLVHAMFQNILCWKIIDLIKHFLKPQETIRDFMQ